MNRISILNQVLSEGIVAILRMDQEEGVLETVDALRNGGLHAIEITVGTPGAMRLIQKVASQRPDVLIGVGSVLDSETARMALYSGAKFIVTPVSRREVIELAHRYDAPVFSGAFSPGEILTAFEYGADIVKVFPAEVLGIPYLKAVKAPMPQLQLMPTGGVTADNVGEWLQAGACAVGVSSALVPKKAVAEKNFEVITQTAARFIRNIADARAKS